MISIIVPVYNAKPYIKRCVDSLLQQTEKDIQIILVDDGSTDEGLKQIPADPRVEVYEQVHAGQSAARNLGLTHAKGEFIAFVDADDYIEPDWCAQHLKAIEGVDYVQSQHPRHRYQYTAVWGRLYRREAIEGMRFIEGMIYEDVIWSVDLWRRGLSCRCIPYAGYHYTVNPNSTTSQRHPEAEKRVFAELKKRGIIGWYTLIRLKIHFWKS